MNEAGHDAAPPNVTPLAPGEIAYRDFGREPDGLAEQEVRDFLGVVADVVAAGREREHGLEQQVRELQDRLAQRPADSGAAARVNDERVDELFTALRDYDLTPPPRVPRAAKRSKAQPPAVDPRPGDSAVDQAAPAPEPDAPEAERPDDESAPPEVTALPTGDDRLRADRDGVTAPLAADLLRVTKRLLQQEQNVLLDAARRGRSRLDPTRVLPDPADQRELWAAALTPALDLAYGAGRTSVGRSRRPARAPERVVNEISAALIWPLRERLAATIASVSARGPYESAAELHRELAGSIGARYREWRTADLETGIDDALAAAFARGAYDGAPAGSRLRWVTSSGTRCPDCDDNGLEPTVKGQPFPTGQSFPPAHPGCRCFVVLVEVDAASEQPSVP